MRIKGLSISVLSVLLMLSGAMLLAYFALGAVATAAPGGTDADGFDVPVLEDTEQAKSAAGVGPEDQTLELTIPKMARVENATVPDAAGDDEEALKTNAAIHLQGTDFPWEEGANVYIAGHRLGVQSQGVVV